jgi:hypothetical protein
VSAEATKTYPIRQRSARGVPAEGCQFLRRCVNCRASFLGLAPGKTGERGIWRDWSWFCSAECAGHSLDEATP